MRHSLPPYRSTSPMSAPRPSLQPVIRVQRVHVGRYIRLVSGEWVILIFRRTRPSTFKPESVHGHAADGLLIVLVVENIDDEYARIQQEGVPITTPIETEPWGERYFQITDPYGIVYSCTVDDRIKHSVGLVLAHRVLRVSPARD